MTSCIGISILLALAEPPLVQWIILFSLGGIGASAFAPVLIGMFWKRGNHWGALAAIAVGMTLYVLAYTVAPQIGVFGMHASFACTLASTLAYVAVSLATPPPAPAIVRTFWGKAA
jgi:sodium/pantothenate symporter